jgi:filamentous hemagglutinin family protein
MLKTGHRTKYHLRAFEFLAARRRSRAVLTCTLLASFLATMPTGGLQAGDILRGGASAGNAKRNSEARANAGAAAAEAAKVRAQDRLARTTKAVNDMRALQASARAAAAANTIPNGLIEGGLNPIVGGTWTGANPATASGNNVNITQTASQALLEWETFNVGSQTTVNFDQSAGGADSGKWIAFNKVVGSAAPSQIRGKINAQGQVYIINQNGIVFGAGSQVNTRALVASTLPINDNLVASGLLNNKDAQFLFSALEVPGVDGTPTFTPTDVPAVLGDVVVERGAKISSPELAGGNGGRVMLVGANVRNEGEISTPAGQTILAAGLQVGVAAHAESDPSLRGLDIWVGDVGNYAGTITNTGLVESQRGSILAVGKEINQNGVLESSTSVNLNGRIDLLASYGALSYPDFENPEPPFINQHTGIVRFATGSTTRILPDFSSNKKIPGTKLAQSSQVNIEGLGIHLASGSSLIATSGLVNIRAGIWPILDSDDDGKAIVPPTEKKNLFDSGPQKFRLSSGQVNIASGALLDASGTVDAFVPLAQNFLAVQLRGSELADSPIQRSGDLRGKPLLVDLRRTGTYGGRGWIGTPLGDLTGFANITERDIAQLTTRGGSISISAGDSVVATSGATIDVSGGYFTHEGGLVQTTRLLRGANLVDMHNATPDVAYDGVYNGLSNYQSEKWGVAEIYTQALAPLGGGNERHHVEGASAGTLSITAPKMALGADLLGQSITGPRQQASPAGQGTLQINFQREIQFNPNDNKFLFIKESPNAPNLIFLNSPSNHAGLEFELVEGEPAPMSFAAGSDFTASSAWWDEEEGGFGNISINNSEGDITVPGNTPLELPAGGSLTLVGRNISFGSAITIPGGSLTATAYNYTPLAYAQDQNLGLIASTKPSPLPIADQGIIRVAPGVLLDVAGQFIDERPSSNTEYQEKYVLKGGSVSLTGYSVLLGANSLVDASGGARARPNGKFQYGNGGSISLLAGKDPVLATTTSGELSLMGTLQAYSVAKGGSLTLQANAIQIGGTATSGGLALQPDFFRSGGFTSYSLRGIGSRAVDGSLIPGIRVLAGTVIEPVAENWRHMPFTSEAKLQSALGRLGNQESTHTGAILAASSSNSDATLLGLRRFSSDTLFPVLLPEGLRQAASVTFSSIGYDDGFTPAQTEAIGILDYQAGAKILTDAGATVRLSGELIRIAGEISAPGGTIEIAGSSSFKPLDPSAGAAPNFALPTVYITKGANLSVAGKTIPLADPYDWNAGIIHPGGTIKISGNILAEAGSILDASGTSAVLDFHPLRLNPALVSEVPKNSGLNSTPWQRRAIAVQVDSDGGRIELSGAQFLYVDSTLSARAGGESAMGGTLSVSSGRFYPSDGEPTGADTNLYVGATGLASRIADTATLAGITNSLVASTTPDADLAAALLAPPAGSQGIGFFAMDRFAGGGFDFLDLGFKYFQDAAPIPYGGNLEFLESVSINAKGAVRLAGGGVIRSTFPVSITSPYVAIGQEFRAPLNPADLFDPFVEFKNNANSAYNLPPTPGVGSLAINARLIDIGTLVTLGLSSASFSAPTGDIRGNGILSVAGSITLATSQVYPTTAAKFDVFAYDNGPNKGSISVVSNTTPALPLSAGGSMRLFADTINISGNLRAPMGSIVLGWDGTAASKPENTVVGTTAVLTKTTNLNLSAGASLSVSGVDPTTGQGILVPYGISPDGLTWIDPRGEDITVSGLPDRRVTLAAESVSMASTASIDLRGGGDLLAYRWISGVGGSSDLLGTATLSWSSGSEYNAGDLVLHGGKTWSARRDLDPSDFTTPPEPSESTYWSLVPESYAILPRTSFAFAPYNSFNTGVNSGSLAGDPGFVSSTLRVGEQIQLPSSSGLPAGSYTLLPKRYGILPGAYLVVPQSGSLASTGSVRTTRSPGALKASAANNRGIEMEEGSRFVYGYAQNGLANAAAAPSVYARFEVVPPSVIQNRVQFDKYEANSFLSSAAARLGLTETQRLPMDSAPLQIQGNTGLSLLGSVLAPSTIGGRGADIDLSSDSPIEIHAAGTPAIAAALDASVITSWNANSLLIGALRTTSSEGITLDVRTSDLTLNAPELKAAEILLASQGELVLADGSSLTSTGSGGSTKNLLIEGDGTLVRVSSAQAAVSRTATTGAPSAFLQIGQNTSLTGSSVNLDSSRSSVIDPSLNIDAQNLALGAGQISLVFDTLPGGLAGSQFATHLILQGQFLLDALSAQSLTLQSYTTIDLYSNASVSGTANSIELLASGLRGYTSPGSTIQLTASDILVSNPNSATALPASGASEGTLSIASETMRFGENAFSMAGFQNFNLSATRGASIASSGSFAANGDFLLSTPSLTAARATSYSLSSTGDFELAKTVGASTTSSGLGATLSLSGTSVEIGTDILLPSGLLDISATTGSILVTGTLSAAGKANTFFDLTRYTDGGDIELNASAGSINLAAGSLVSVAAPASGGSAGRLTIKSPGGAFLNDGSLNGQGGSDGRNGSFVLDAQAVADFDALTDSLEDGGFTHSMDFRLRTGDVTIGRDTTAQSFLLSADGGSITVNNQIDASGEMGGRIELIARNNLTLSPTGSLTVAAQRFSNAGKGGHIHLEAGAAVNGSPNTDARLDLQKDAINDISSSIDLSVKPFSLVDPIDIRGEYVEGDYLRAGSSAFNGKFQGTLHLRAPRTADNSGIQIDPISSTITGASAIIAEGFKLYDLTDDTVGDITLTVDAGSRTLEAGKLNTLLRDQIDADNLAFLGTSDDPAANDITLLSSLLATNPDAETLAPLFIVAPGVEIINRNVINPKGDLTLGLANNQPGGKVDIEGTTAADWDLSSWRYGTRQAPGILTLRAKGDLVFNNTLSDGFTPVAITPDTGHSTMWLATPQTINTLLPTNLQSWAYRFAAGSDMASTSHRHTVSADTLDGKGSILVGEFYPAVPNTLTSGTSAAIDSLGQTADTIRIIDTRIARDTTNRGTRYEVVRTGTGDIDIAAARDVQLRNPFSTIYTSGVALPAGTRIFEADDFSLPMVKRTSNHPDQGILGAVQQGYDAYYTLSGGGIRIAAGNDIGRFTQSSGVTMADASRQLPTNWLYRRGQVDPATGLFSTGGVGTGGIGTFTDSSASTTWWVDFSNYFGGFATLGGGDISLVAGRDLVNADAAVPTNARMAGLAAGQRIAPNMAKFLELGGGDLKLSAGRNIDGGSFVVERGSALLVAGAEVTTNSAQTPSRGLMKTPTQSSTEVYDELVWQPVTLFGSHADFTVNARGDVLIGPITNSFLLPQGLNNKYWYKTQFHTIDELASATLNSFGGSITHRLAITIPDNNDAISVLERAYEQTSIATDRAGYFRPWLRVAESNLSNFKTASTVSLPSLKSIAHGGDINISGELNLFPSTHGALELLAANSITGLSHSGFSINVEGRVGIQTAAWITSTINLSDANPENLSGILTPYSIQSALNSRTALILLGSGIINPFENLNRAFDETGSFIGDKASIDIKSALHNASPLHSGNPNPLRLYSAGGDLSGVTLYSAKKVQTIAMRDITDIAFYLQHTGEEDISIVSAGRDVIPFNENYLRRATAADLSLGNSIVGDGAQALPGDIQIGGRGVLEVLAGRNVDLGTGPNLDNGTGIGITSIGRSRNPFLPFEGAELVVLAGVGGASGGPAIGLAKSILNFSALKDGMPATEFDAVIALKGLFVELARIGESALESGDYSEGFALVNQLFGPAASTGDLFTRARDIRTASGGAITIAAPGGGVTMASDIFGNPLTPPGIVTEYGGAISILTDGNVDIGQARIFTLRGGDLTIWSSSGDIAAGNAPKTVVTAPPTRVLIDATSADIQTDLGGLATGGGIGVLAAVEGVEPGAVNLIAPEGTVDAGDAGIRATGDIKIAAAAVVNADNISAGGTSAGVPSSPTVAAPNIGGLTSGSSSTAAASSAASQVSQQSKTEEKPVEDTPSLITVEVLGYGGGDSSSEKEDEQTSAEG